MIAKVESRTTYGISGIRIDVEVDVAGGGMPGFCIVGLPDTACKESAKRVMSAMKNSNYSISAAKITVNLAPAHIKKEGPSFDLPIAVGILAAKGLIKPENLRNFVVCGELSLDGTARAINGALPRAVSVEKDKTFIVPKANINEASIVKQCKTIGVSSLIELVNFLNNKIKIDPVKTNYNCNIVSEKFPDFSEVKGNMHAKRAIEVASAGNHNILLIGPPGEGKSMLARRIPSILDNMTYEQALETTKIHSIVGLTKNKSGLLDKRPFRPLHHSISDAGMLGGGTMLNPGEISLAHNGVLFLDEIAEFRRNILEAMRQPLEDKKILISRVSGSVEYPADFMLVAAMNPCPCGYLTHPTKECSCTPLHIQRYLNKISGPLLDRIDIQIEVLPLEYSQLIGKNKNESSEEIKKRIIDCRKIQQKRYKNTVIRYNGQLTPKYMDTFSAMTDQAEKLLKIAITELSLSARAYDKIRKISRTIADLENKELIQACHVSEAIGYRSLDRKLWLE